MLLRRGVFVLGLAALVLGNVACHVEVNVTIDDNFFDPKVAAIAGSGDVIWQNQGSRRHSVTSRQDFFDSGKIESGEGFSHQFNEAGGFSYVCTFHNNMTGRINVPTQADPDSGTTSDVFTIEWAFFDSNEGPGPAAIPPGFDMDVQVKNPGSDKWKIFLADQTAAQTQTSFSPPKKGVFRFRARLQETSSGDASAYSPPARIEVSEP